MKAKLLKITELLKAEKAYNNIPYVLGMLDAMVMDLEKENPAIEKIIWKSNFLWKK